MLGSIAAAAPVIAMLGCIACLIGGAALVRRGNRQKGGLMLVMAAVLLGNVLIWMV